MPPVAEEPSNAQAYLEDWQREVVLFIERYHAVSGTVPDDDDILEWVNSVKPHWNFSKSELTELKSNKLFKASMRKRGIYLDVDLNLDLGQLSPRQMGTAAVMMDILDRRSDEKKLRDMGISTQEWSTWRQNKAFNEYLASRSELLIEGSQHEAHIALMRAVRAGNISAVKYFNEMVGRFNPDKDQAVDLRVFIGRLLEVIQKHVKDPETLGRLGSEMSQIMLETTTGMSPTYQTNTIKGELI